MKKSEVEITIFIPTYNAATYINELLVSIFLQTINKKFEVLVIDSGSSDDTVSIIQKFDKVRLHEIPNSEFGHGKTRQLAAEMAHGEVVVYLSHDAIPAHNRWLYELIKPFEFDERVAGVMGKQIPRPHCFPLMKYEIQDVFNGFGPDFGTTIFYKDDFIQSQGVYDAVRFYSDVNSAARKKFLLGDLPYRDVPYAEDQLFGEDVIEAGFYKAYAPRGSVIHSNDVSLSEYAKRMFDETLGLRRGGSIISKTPMYKVIYQSLRHVARDARRIIGDSQYSFRRKLYWLVVNPLFHIQRQRGIRQALSADLEGPTNKKSLEHGRRQVD